MTQSADLLRDYRVAFLSYLHGRREAGRHRGYLLGRAVLVEGHGLLDLARAHHDVFLELLRDTSVEEQPELVSAAAEFFLEVLAPAEMAQRGLGERAGAAKEGAGPRPGPGGSPAEVLSGGSS